jgi:hypothetical protein
MAIMLSFFLTSALSQDLPPRTAIVFAGDLVYLSTESGPRLVYGAYFPNSTSPTLSSDSSAFNATLTFPDYCSGIGLSNYPNFNFLLPLNSDIPGRPFVNICIWLHSTPANISYSYYSDTNNTLQLERLDDIDIPPRLVKPRDRFEFQHDILLRWMILSPEESSPLMPSLRIDPAPGYAPEKTFSTYFVVGDTDVYFDPPPPTDSPQPSESPDQTESPTETSLQTIPAASVTESPVTATPEPTGEAATSQTVGFVILGLIAAIVIGGAGFFVHRWYMARRGGRPERKEELPSEPRPVQGIVDAPSSGLLVPYPGDGEILP